MYEGCTRNAYHLYMFRYEKERFANLPRARFLKALSAEGVPASGGYSPLNKEPFLEHTLVRALPACLRQAHSGRIPERMRCPANDKLCEEGVG